ncbi:nicotinamide-nucleotide adenylyltransferase/nicotinate-nucleotide adenylyltransferase [Mycobacteriaceae bacterium]
MSSTEHWPVDKIAGNLARPPRGRRCVLLTTGALNPVHRGHVAMFDRARDVLEAEYGIDVVGGFLSPSHDTYLSGKYLSGKHRDERFFPAAQRLALCAAATEDHPFLAVASWESSVSGHWPDFPEVTATLERVLDEPFPGEGIGVIYLCGQDHFRYAARARLPGVAVVTRAGRAERSDTARTIFAVPTASDDPYRRMSSTQVREALKNDDVQTLRSCLHPAVLAMLLRWR